jgi:hypothetical protein
VRKLCPKCKTPYTPSGALLDEIKSSFNLAHALSAINANSPLPVVKTTASPVEPTKPVAQPVADKAPLLRQDSSRKVIPVPESLDLERRSILDRIAQDPNIIDRPSGDGDDSAIGLPVEETATVPEPKQPTESRGEEKIQQLTPSSSSPTQNVVSSLDEMPPATNPNSNTESLVLYRAVGCKQCGNSGFSGRIGIYEVLEVTPQIGSLITSKATADEIQKSAISNGMSTMQEDGLLKALQAMTTIEEVLRVTRE